jgi:hypothetical protein
MKTLVDKYSAATQLQGGTTAMTAFPGMAWQHADFTGGALLTKVGRPFSGANIAPQSIVMSVGEQRIVDAAGLGRQVDEWRQGGGGGGDVKVTVKSGAEPARVVDVRRR